MSHKKVANKTHVGSEAPREIAVPLLLARLIGKMKFTESGCWEWKGGKNKLGYAQAYLGGKRYMVHRFMYEACNGAPIPEGREIAHSCHNRACFNPYHIRSATHHENLAESSQAKRLSGNLQTHCKRGHLLAGDNLQPGKVFRSCRICSRGRYRKRLGWPDELAFSVEKIPHGYSLETTKKDGPLGIAWG